MALWWLAVSIALKPLPLMLVEKTQAELKTQSLRHIIHIPVSVNLGRSEHIAVS